MKANLTLIAPRARRLARHAAEMVNRALFLILIHRRIRELFASFEALLATWKSGTLPSHAIAPNAAATVTRTINAAPKSPAPRKTTPSPLAGEGWGEGSPHPQQCDGSAIALDRGEWPASSASKKTPFTRQSVMLRQ